MSFYDALQMDPSVLKKKISRSNEKKEKVYYWAAITVRAILIVAFCLSLHCQIFSERKIRRWQ